MVKKTKTGRALRIIEHEKPALPALVDPKLPLPAPGTPESMLHSLTLASMNKDVDVSKMERMYAMYKEVVATRAEQQFNEALSRAQAKVEPIATNASNNHTDSRYTKLEAIAKIIIPIYSEEGFSLSFNNVAPTIKDGGEHGKPWIRIEAILSHKGGHTRKYHIELPPDDTGAKGTTNKTGVQASGSTNSYARRYLTMMIFNVTTFDDRDGGNAEGKGLSDKVLADHLAAIDAAANRNEVIKAFREAWNAADDINDKASRTTFMNAKNKRLKALGFES